MKKVVLIVIAWAAVVAGLTMTVRTASPSMVRVVADSEAPL